MKYVFSALAAIALVFTMQTGFAANPADSAEQLAKEQPAAGHRARGDTATDIAHQRSAGLWTGFYLGAAVGTRAADNTWDTKRYTSPGGAAIPFASKTSEDFSSFAPLVGPYVGYMRQVGPRWVVGVEGDFHWVNNNDGHPFIPGANNAVTPTGTVSTKIQSQWDGSMRLRGGYLFAPDMLGYLTAGLSLQRTLASQACFSDTNVCNPAFHTQIFMNDRVRAGGVLGGGVEKSLGNHLYLRAQYTVADYFSSGGPVMPPNPIKTFGVFPNIDSLSQTLTVGLAYKF